MKIQVVEPVKCIGYASEVTDTSLCIASVLHPTMFTSDYLNIFSMYKELWVDNGAFEAGVGSSVKDYENVIKKQIAFANRHNLNAGKTTHFALPDVAGDSFGTMQLYHNYIPLFDSYLSRHVDRVAVPQGRNFDDFSYCVDFYKSCGIKTFGFSVLDRRWMRPAFEDIREDMFRWFHEQFNIPWNRIHVLGFDLEDANNECFFYNNSVDTAYPYNCILTKKNIGRDAKRPKDYFNKSIPKIACVQAVTNFIDWLCWQERFA